MITLIQQSSAIITLKAMGAALTNCLNAAAFLQTNHYTIAVRTSTASILDELEPIDDLEGDFASQVRQTSVLEIVVRK